MPSTVYINARLFTATDESVIDSGALWVEDGKIRYAGPVDALPATPPDTEIIDVAGRFVMPGMTETHAHLSFADASPFAIGATPVEQATITAVGNAASHAGFGVHLGDQLRLHLQDRRGAAARPSTAGQDRQVRAFLAAGRDLGATASNVDSGWRA